VYLLHFLGVGRAGQKFGVDFGIELEVEN